MYQTKTFCQDLSFCEPKCLPPEVIVTTCCAEKKIICQKGQFCVTRYTYILVLSLAVE